MGQDSSQLVKGDEQEGSDTERVVNVKYEFEHGQDSRDIARENDRIIRPQSSNGSKRPKVMHGSPTSSETKKRKKIKKRRSSELAAETHHYKNDPNDVQADDHLIEEAATQYLEAVLMDPDTHIEPKKKKKSKKARSINLGEDENTNGQDLQGELPLASAVNWRNQAVASSDADVKVERSPKSKRKSKKHKKSRVEGPEEVEGFQGEGQAPKSEGDHGQHEQPVESLPFSANPERSKNTYSLSAWVSGSIAEGHIGEAKMSSQDDLQLPPPQDFQMQHIAGAIDDDGAASSHLIRSAELDRFDTGLNVIQDSQIAARTEKKSKNHAVTLDYASKRKKGQKHLKAKLSKDLHFSDDDFVTSQNGNLRSTDPQSVPDSYPMYDSIPPVSPSRLNGVGGRIQAESTFLHPGSASTARPSRFTRLERIDDEVQSELPLIEIHGQSKIRPKKVKDTNKVLSLLKTKSGSRSERSAHVLADGHNESDHDGYLTAKVKAPVKKAQEIEQPIPQIGIYRVDNAPVSNVKRKRRLPVDDDDNDGRPIEVSEKKKRRKTDPNPKTPTSTGKAVSRAEPSSGMGQITIEKGKGTSRSAAKPVTINGKFSDQEIAIINNEMLKYREMHDMSEFDLNQLVQDNANNAEDLWNSVIFALEGRSRQAVLKICRRRFHNFESRGRWTKEEDEELRKACRIYPNGWKQIGLLLNRLSEDCRDRWRNYLICGDNLKKDVWSEEEERALQSVVTECLEIVRELKNAHPSKRNEEKNEIELVDWQVVSEKLGRTRSRLQCINKWKFLMDRQTIEKEDMSAVDLNAKSWRIDAAKKDYTQMRRTDKLALLRGIRDSQAGREGKVPWQHIGNPEFRGKWTCMARKVAWKKLRATIPRNEDIKLQELVSMLIGSVQQGDEDPVNDDLMPARREKTIRKPRKQPISKVFIDEHDDADEIINPIRGRSKKIKLSDRMARENESADPLDEPFEIAQQHADDDYDLPRISSTFNSTANSNHKTARDSLRNFTHKSFEQEEILDSEPEDLRVKPNPRSGDFDGVDGFGTESDDSSDMEDIPARLPMRRPARELSVELGA